MMLRLKLLLAALIIATGSALAADIVVIDGDTFELGGTRYRIHGIDAPEAGQPCQTSGGGTWNCAAAATEALEELLFSAAEVRCDPGSPDGYGRTISVCWADGLNIGRAMVQYGFAWSFKKFSSDYDDDEHVARQAGLGIWVVPTQPAWEFRDARWNSFGSEAPDPNCPIKGNISREGERIYHAPWSPVYSRTKISPENGERWFCDEGEAVEAGWRPAYWGRRSQ